MVVVDGDNQMFYNTSRERIMGEDGYVAENGDHERKCDSAPSPDKHQDDTRDAGPKGFYSHETRDEPDCSREDSDDAGRDQLDQEDMPTRCEGFECPFCPSKFSWRSALMQHQESLHRDEQMLICDQCDKIFTDAGDLQRHIRTQHAGTRAHSCPECGKTFATSSGLKQHTHIHSSVKPFICEVCLKSYTQFSNLCRHKRMHADCRTQLKCPTCGQMYTTITSLNKHRRFCHSASPLVSRHHLSPSAISPPGIPPPPSVLPYSPPLIGLPPSALYQASLAQMWNAQQALLAQSLGKAAMMPSPYLLGYPPSLSTPAPLYPSSLHPGAALGEGHKKLADGQFPSLPSWMSPLSVTYGKEPTSKHDEEELSVEKRHREEERNGDDSERQFKRMRVESVSPAPSPPSNRVEQCPSSPADNEPTKVPSFIPRAAVSPLTGPNPPRITSPANSLGHQEDGRSAFSPPQVSPVSSTGSTSEERSPRKSGEQQPLDLTMQKTPSPPARSLHSDPVSPLSSSFPSDRLSHLLERRKSTGGLFGFPTAATGYPTPLPSSLDPMYKVKLEQHQQQLAQHYSRSAAALTGLAATFPPSNILGSPQAAFLKYHNLHHGAVRQFPFGVGGGVVYPASSKDMMIRGGKDRYTCKFCGKLFPRSANLTRHLRTHTGEQPYSCKYCDRSFSISSNLQRHVRNIHNKEKPFKCPLCDRCFGQQTNLDRHLKKHDNEQNGEVTTTIKRAPDHKAVDIDVEEDVPEREESGVAKLGSPGSPAAVTPSPPASPLRSSEPAQPLKIQYKIARGRSPLSSSGTCQSPPSTKIDSGLVSPPRDDGTRGAEGEGEKVHPFSYMVNGPSSWERQGLGIHKPKAILT